METRVVGQFGRRRPCPRHARDKSDDHAVGTDPFKPTHYHRLLPMNTVYRGALLDLLAAILLSTVVFWILHRRDPEAKTLGWLLVIAVLLMRTAACLGNAELLSRRISPNRVFFASLLAGLLLWFLRRSWYAAAMRGARTLILLVGFAIFWILPQLAWMPCHAEPAQGT